MKKKKNASFSVSAAQEAIDYLYTLPDETEPWLAKGIDMLRQLINEEFVAKDNMVGNQFLYDMLYPLVLFAQKKELDRLVEIEDKSFKDWDKKVIANFFAEVGERYRELENELYKAGKK